MPPCNNPQRGQQKTPIVYDGRISYCISPIIQALAPCCTAGCCAVNELVSRALFMVIDIIHFSLIPVNKNKMLTQKLNSYSSETKWLIRSCVKI